MTASSEDRPSTRPRQFVAWIGVVAIVTALVVVIGLIAWHAVSDSDNNGASVDSSSSLLIGKQAPTNFQLDNLRANQQLSLRGLIAARPTIINFFASWCNACAQELDAFATVASQEHGAQFIGIDTNDFDPSEAIKLLNAARATYLVMRDTTSLAVATAYGVADLPITFFINARGTVVDAVLGKQSATALRDRARALIAGRQPR